MIRFTAAQLARAKRRKSGWNLLLLPAVLLPLAAMWAGLCGGANLMHMQLYPGESLRTAKGLWPILATLAPFFAATPLAMLIGNFIVWLVPPARRALDIEASAYPGTSFRASQAALIRLTLYLTPLSIAACLVAAALPW
jgi:hypothetical protein